MIISTKLWKFRRESSYFAKFSKFHCVSRLFDKMSIVPCMRLRLLLHIVIFLLAIQCGIPGFGTGFLVSSQSCKDKAKPHICPPHWRCFGIYYYCSSVSKTVEACVREIILKNNASRFELCQNVYQEKPILEEIRDESCNLKADCIAEYGQDLFPPDQNKEYELTVTLIIIVILAVIIIVGLILYICYKKFKKSRDKDEEAAPINEAPPPVNIENERQLDNTAHNNEVTEAADSEHGNRTEIQPLLLRQSDNASNASSTEESGVSIPSGDISTGSSVRFTPNISSASSIETSGIQQREDNLHSTPPINSAHHGRNGVVHPSEIESSNQRAFHMPSTEPSDNRQHMIVTSQSNYNIISHE